MNLSKIKIKYVQSLKDKKFRDEYRVFVAEGDKMVLDLLPYMHCLMLIGTDQFLAENMGNEFNIDEVVEVTRTELGKVSLQRNPQRVLGVFFQPKHTFDEKEISKQLIIALDGIQDPGNLGTIIRLADWYGIETIICSKDTVDVYNPKVVQATMGALARVKVYYVDLVECISQFKNVPIYGTFLNGNNIFGTDISDNGIIVMGNEGRGIRSNVEDLVTERLFIPNYPANRTTSESLNVAIATAIVCSEFRRRLS